VDTRRHHTTGQPAFDRAPSRTIVARRGSEPVHAFSGGRETRGHARCAADRRVFWADASQRSYFILPVTTPARDEDVLELDAPEWARVEKVSLIRREIRESLSPNALDLLFAKAEKVVESGEDSGGLAVYATVMVTIDLAKLDELTREPADAATAHSLVALVEKNRAVATRLKQYARPYLCELAERSVGLSEIKVELRVRSEASTLLIDGDAMVSLQDPSSSEPSSKGSTRG